MRAKATGTPTRYGSREAKRIQTVTAAEATRPQKTLLYLRQSLVLFLKRPNEDFDTESAKEKALAALADTHRKMIFPPTNQSLN